MVACKLVFVGEEAEGVLAEVEPIHVAARIVFLGERREVPSFHDMPPDFDRANVLDFGDLLVFLEAGFIETFMFIMLHVSDDGRVCTVVIGVIALSPTCPWTLILFRVALTALGSLTQFSLTCTLVQSLLPDKMAVSLLMLFRHARPYRGWFQDSLYFHPVVHTPVEVHEVDVIPPLTVVRRDRIRRRRRRDVTGWFLHHIHNVQELVFCRHERALDDLAEAR
mmetsp:Transcript_20194/g.27447  ORF Transcript_20194/g.27447 Transcript_20194/m.27447 type:complete len:223 (-) Transcript_20194:105-773(-)